MKFQNIRFLNNLVSSLLYRWSLNVSQRQITLSLKLAGRSSHNYNFSFSGLIFIKRSESMISHVLPPSISIRETSKSTIVTVITKEQISFEIPLLFWCHRIWVLASSCQRPSTRRYSSASFFWRDSLISGHKL